MWVTGRPSGNRGEGGGAAGGILPGRFKKTRHFGDIQGGGGVTDTQPIQTIANIDADPRILFPIRDGPLDIWGGGGGVEFLLSYAFPIM